MPRIRSRGPGASVRLVGARFVARPNRFVVRARLERRGAGGDAAGGTEVEAHLADPGRLVELLQPGVALRLAPAPPGPRRTRYTVELVAADRGERTWVSVRTGRANALLAQAISDGVWPDWAGASELRAEVRDGDSRFDFRLRRPDGGTIWIEAKSVTLVERGVGLFPDAPTARGRRHVAHLARLAEAGDGAALVFVVQRGDARAVRLHDALDPDFAGAVRAARRSGVDVRALRFAFDRKGAPSPPGILPFDDG